MKNKIKRFILLVKSFGIIFAIRETTQWILRQALSDYASSRFINKDSKNLTYKQKISNNLRPFPKQWFYLNKKKSFFSNEKLNIKKILIIADLNIPQCNIYRVDGLISYLNVRGISAEKSFFLDVERIRKNLDSSCAVIFYRVPLRDELLDIIYECKRSNIKMFYDIDDPVFSFTTYSDYENLKYVDPIASKNILEGTPKYFAMMSFCEAIIVSTPKLAQLAKKYLPDKGIYVRRNYISSERLLNDENINLDFKEIKTISITSGSIGHEDDFKMIQKPLENILRKYKNLELVLLGKFKKSLFSKAINERIKSHIEFQEYENYIKSLSETDISLIPIKKSSFNECKSIVRLLDCCNAGVPSIASDIGDYRDSYDTMPFFEIASDNEWEEKICKLIEDSSLREFYSENSREFIKSISSGFSGYISHDDFIEKIL